MSRFQLVLLLTTVLTGCAGSQHPWSRRTLCELELEQEGPVRSHETWISLLLRGYDPATKRVTTPAIDCTDAQIRWEAPSSSCFDGALSKAPLPNRPLTERDVVVTPYGDNYRLVWIQTSRFASGDAMGPVAVVELKRQRLVVRAIGVLRAYPTRTQLRLENLGKLEVLVADGESCTSSDRASCQRAARVLPLRGDRYVPEPLVSAVGACVSAAWFDLAREEVEPLPETGWKRRYRLDAALTFEGDVLHVQEQLAIHDIDPHKAQAPPRLFRRAQGDRTVELLDNRLVSTGKPIWTKVVKGGE